MYVPTPLLIAAGIKAAAGSSVLPLFATAIALRLLRPREGLRSGRVVLAWLIAGPVMLLWLGALAIVSWEALNTDAHMYPEGHIALAGGTVTHVFCCVLLIRAQKIWARSRQRRGFAVAVGLT